MNHSKGKSKCETKRIRCAIYTRKSTEEGLQQEFNSLDAQRESGEAYVAAQKHEGWVCLPDRYDDGGFSGGNMDRPAVQRLLKDIDDGKIDCVVVYKVDRLSRSLLDFAQMMQRFDKRNVSFVSVTQQFNTTHSMGRLTLNILLSFAQFEREIISERTRDKIAAARRRGKFAGGKPLLGYDLLSSPTGSKLLVNADEAEQVREIFNLYLQHESLIPVVKELNQRGWTTKTWQTRDGRTVGGRTFDKNLLHALLTNVVFLGKVRYHEEVHPGEHEAIVDESVWKRVQAILQRNNRSGGALVRNQFGALLKGILRCETCKCAMMHTYSVQATKRYRYYVCIKAQKRGWHSCTTKSVPAAEIERFVIDQIRAIGRDPAVLRETIRQTRLQSGSQIRQLQLDEKVAQKELTKLDLQLRKADAGQLATIQERIRQAEQRMTLLREEMARVNQTTLDDQDIQSALCEFDPLWESLTPREQARIIRLLVERVDYNGKDGSIAITFRPNGIKTLAQEREEIAA